MKTLEEIIKGKKLWVEGDMEGIFSRDRGRIEEAVLKSERFSEEQKLSILSDFYDVPYTLSLSEKEIDFELVRLLPISFAKRFKLIPLRNQDGKVLLALAPPLDLYALDEVRSLFDSDVEPVLVPDRTVLDCINRVYERGTEMTDEFGSALGITPSEFEEPKDLLEAEDEAPIIRFVNSLLFRAVKERASDIHIECFEKEVAARFRKDGMLHQVTSVPKRLQSSIISRIKIMAELDIAEKRKPQDGRIRVKIAGRDVDVRISTVPTSHGESVVMRLLDKSAVLLELEELGLGGKKLDTINLLIHRPHGIILVTGPTGSGKTTTLYAALSRINSPDKKIITIEDPVEYQIQGINQIQVNPKVDLTFANGLRSILRQDPDVILVGEIRDKETAEIAIHASLTGHLVFSTLHTNDAASAITRLVDMGIEPFLVASSLVAVIAQRLVRFLCRDCREAYEPTAEELRSIDLSRDQIPGGRLYRVRGCEGCLHTGYSGRAGIFEVLLLDEDTRNLTLATSDSNTIKKKGIQKGMTSLKMDGANKILRGLTSIDEVLRVAEEGEL